MWPRFNDLRFRHTGTEYREEDRAKGQIGEVQRFNTCQGTPRIAGDHQKVAEVKKDSSPEPSEGAGPCQHLDFRLLAPRTIRSHPVRGTLFTAEPGNQSNAMAAFSLAPEERGKLPADGNHLHLH